MWNLVPYQGSNLGPLHWGHGVLATGPATSFVFSQPFLGSEACPPSLAIPAASPQLKCYPPSRLGLRPQLFYSLVEWTLEFILPLSLLICRMG